MKRRNPKEYNGYNEIYWFLPWDEYEKKLSDTPIKFRGKRISTERARYLFADSFGTTTISNAIETRTELNFKLTRDALKQKDLILFSLNKDTKGEYTEAGKVRFVRTRYDDSLGIRNLRAKRNDKIFTVGIEL